MESIREYLLSVICAAAICSIALALSDKNCTTGKLIKLISGMIMIAVTISPLANIQLENLSAHISSLQIDGKEAVSVGEDYASKRRKEIITEKVQAYIMDKARALNADISVEVELNEEEGFIPASVKITGSISPYCRSILSQDIRQNLGVPEEDQIWNLQS